MGTFILSCRLAAPFALAALVSCTTTTTSTGGPAAYDLTGSWSGSFTSQSGQSGTVTATFTQTGNTVSGSVSSQNSCIGGGKFDGTLSNDSLTGSLTAGGVRATLNGTAASAKQVDGTYSLNAAGACQADSGSFHLSR